jgi:probable blue pigment (indigoidine) exporter
VSASPVRDSLVTAVAPISWGTTYLVTTQFLPPHRPLLAGMLRALPVGILLVAPSRHVPSGVWRWRLIVLGMLNVGAAFACIFIAAYRLPGGVAATIAAAQPFFVLLVAWHLLAERPAARRVAAACTGFAGVGLIAFAPAIRLDPLGLAAAVANPVVIAFGTVLTQHWGRPASLAAFTGWQLVVGGLVLVPLTLWIEGPLPRLSTVNLLALAYLALVGTALAYWLWFRGIERVSASTVTFLVLLVPLVAALLDFVVLHRGFTPMQILGAGMVIGSVVAARPRVPRGAALEEPA